MLNLNDLVRLVKVIPNRYRFYVIILSVCCPLWFSFALQFSGFLQTVLGITGCIVIVAVVFIQLFLDIIENKKSKK